MAKLARITAPDFIRVIEKLGFVFGAPKEVIVCIAIR